MRTGIYARVSTLEQAENGHGLDVQLAQCRALTQAKGWDVVGEYVDDGVSGTRGLGDRPALDRLLADACAGKIEAVVFQKIDRLGRSLSVVLNVIERLNRCHAVLASCHEPLDTSTPFGEAMLQIMGVFAQLDHAQIVERLAEGKAAAVRADGISHGGRLPMGYERTDGGGVAVVEVEADTVRRIFADYEACPNMAKLARELNADGIQTRRGHRWHASSVKSVLGNEDKYRGGDRGEEGLTWPEIIQ